MVSLSTHVIDAVAGGGRPGVAVTVHGARGETVAAATTDEEGRVVALVEDLATGSYRVSWHTGGGFLSSVSVVVELGEDRHYHLPLLVSDASAVAYLGA